jgi:hypothetical protein
MASVAITASLHIACSTHHVTKKQKPQPGPARSPVPKQATHVTLDVEGQKGLNMAEHHERATLDINKSKNAIDEVENGSETEPSAPKFADERWKNGTWDLNMFVKNGKMDWDGVITAGKALSLSLLFRKKKWFLFHHNHCQHRELH